MRKTVIFYNICTEIDQLQDWLFSSLNKFIWIDCNNKFGKVHFIKSNKIEDITHNFSSVSLLN